jgi:DNA adenine methylase
MRSLIRWAGSKSPVLSRLRRFWPGGDARYVEPFAGSASLFFDLEPPHAVLGDLNAELIGAFRAVKRDPGGVLAYLRGLPVGKGAYYRIRAIPPSAVCSIARAARFLYLNRYCFNGLYRTNKEGEFNVPYGPPESPRGVDEGLVNRASVLLGRASLVHGDFEVTLATTRSGDFVYLDPPYAVSSRRVFAEYGPNPFSGADLERLAAALSRLDARGIPFVITYADSSEARRLLERWQPRRIWTRRNIAGFAGSRRGSYELLATNSRPWGTC